MIVLNRYSFYTIRLLYIPIICLLFIYSTVSYSNPSSLLSQKCHQVLCNGGMAFIGYVVTALFDHKPKVSSPSDRYCYVKRAFAALLLQAWYNGITHSEYPTYRLPTKKVVHTNWIHLFLHNGGMAAVCIAVPFEWVHRAYACNQDGEPKVGAPVLMTCLLLNIIGQPLYNLLSYLIWSSQSTLDELEGDELDQAPSEDEEACDLG
jgi:hypothetical protein